MTDTLFWGLLIFMSLTFIPLIAFLLTHKTKWHEEGWDK